MHLIICPKRLTIVMTINESTIVLCTLDFKIPGMMDQFIFIYIKVTEYSAANSSHIINICLSTNIDGSSRALSPA